MEAELSSSYLPLVLMVCSSLSALGSIFIIATYLASPDIDALYNRQLFFLAISDLIMSAGFFLTPWTFDLPPESEAGLCIAQALILSFSRKTSIYICFLVYYSIYTVMTDLYPKLSKQIVNTGFMEEVEDIKYMLVRKMYILCALGFVLSAIITPLPLITSDYGHVDQGWCFLKNTESSLGKIWLFVEFQAFFIGFILSCGFFYWNIRRHMKRTEQQAEFYKVIKKKLIWYPIFAVICFLPVFSNQILQNFTFYDDREVVRCVVGGLNSLSGFFNMIIFGINGGHFESFFCPVKEEDDAGYPLLNKVDSSDNE